MGYHAGSGEMGNLLYLFSNVPLGNLKFNFSFLFNYNNFLNRKYTRYVVHIRYYLFLWYSTEVIDFNSMYTQLYPDPNSLWLKIPSSISLRSKKKSLFLFCELTNIGLPHHIICWTVVNGEAEEEEEERGVLCEIAFVIEIKATIKKVI